jgi:hypothetical protein
MWLILLIQTEWRLPERNHFWEFLGSTGISRLEKSLNQIRRTHLRSANQVLREPYQRNMRAVPITLGHSRPGVSGPGFPEVVLSHCRSPFWVTSRKLVNPPHLP